MATTSSFLAWPTVVSWTWPEHPWRRFPRPLARPPGPRFVLGSTWPSDGPDAETTNRAVPGAGSQPRHNRAQEGGMVAAARWLEEHSNRCEALNS